MALNKVAPVTLAMTGAFFSTIVVWGVPKLEKTLHTLSKKTQTNRNIRKLYIFCRLQSIFARFRP